LIQHVKLQPQQLDAHLKQGLASVYFISGDEPLQLQEAADAIRVAAQTEGYSERQVMHVEPGFDWNQLLAEASALSLFAEKRIIDLRMPSAKPGREGGAALKAYTQSLPPDTLLLIQAGKLEGSARNSAWVKALDKAGVMIQVWPLNAGQTQQWLDRRLRTAGLHPDRDAVQLLSGRIEGNLLAAAQEVEKLRLLHEPGPLSADDVVSAVTDSARYTAFEMVDTALQGNHAHAVKMLQGLREEGVNEVPILWTLSRDIRLLTDYTELQARGENPDRALQSAWRNRHGLLKQAARRLTMETCHALLAQCAQLDAVTKGQAAGNSWDGLLQLVSSLSGKKLFSELKINF